MSFCFCFLVNFHDFTILLNPEKKHNKRKTKKNMKSRYLWQVKWKEDLQGVLMDKGLISVSNNIENTVMNLFEIIPSSGVKIN